MAEPITYDAAEAAQIIGGVTREWVMRKAAAGVIPSRKIGARRRFTMSDLDAYIASTAQAATTTVAGTTLSRSRRRRAS